MLRNLLDVKRTQLEMIKDRGYDISEEENIFDMENEDQMKIFYSGRHEFNIFTLSKVYFNGDEYTYIYYVHPDVDFVKDVFRKIMIEVMRIRTELNIELKNIIIITTKIDNSNFVKMKTEFANFNFQTFNYDELYVNITKHSLQPKEVRKLTDREQRIFIEESRIKKSQLPIIKLIDPMAKYYGWKKGDVIRVEDENNIVPAVVNITIEYYIVL